MKLPIFLISVFLFAGSLFAASEPVGVAPFNSRDKKLGEEIAAHVLVKLQRTRDFTLIEKAQLKKALSEISRSQSGLVRDEDVIKIGEMVGARYLILGEANRIEGKTNQIRASLRIMKLETGVIIGAGSASGSVSKVSRVLANRAIQDLSIYLMMDNKKSAYSILLKLDKGKNPSYKLKQTLVLKFKVLKHRKSARSRVFIRIYSINSRGSMTLIFPNKFSRTRAIEINKEYSIPADSDIFEWELVKPTGTESIQAIVTTKPVDFFNAEKKFMKVAFPTIKRKSGNKAVTYRGIKVKLKKKKLKDWSAERITYQLEE